MDINKEFSTKQIVLLIMPSIEYNKQIINIVKQLSKGSICYVTLNKTYESLKELFKKNGIKVENIVFVDGITKTIKKVSDTVEGCYFVSSPAALTDLAITISELLHHNFNCIIFDSLTNLLIYERRAPVAKFVSDIVNRIRESKTKAVFYALSMKEQSALIEESGMFVDDVIVLGK